MTEIVLCLSVLIVSAALTGVIRLYALKKSLVDIPNERSSHWAPTPRGGGLAIAVSFLLALVFLYGQGYVQFESVAALLGGGVLVAGIGFWDDHGHIPARWRIIAHIAASSWVLFWLGGFPVIQFGRVLVDFGLLGYVVGIALMVWLLNLFNFMDGIDGIASIEVLFVAGVSGVILLRLEGMQGSALLFLALAFGCLGFLVWNWPPARIFMGDVGSGFLGFMLGATTIMAVGSKGMNLWTFLILASVFIVDATITLLRRILRGDRWYEAHRSHAYQNASRKWGSHLKVIVAVTGINLFWLLPLAVVPVYWPQIGVLCLMMAWLPLCYIAFRLKAGIPI